MNVVIVGGGKLGSNLILELSKEQYNITLIEKDAELCERLTNKFDIIGFVGNGCHYDTQMEARVSECDIFISVTSDDETNIIAATMARHIGADYSIARVRDPGFAKQSDFMREQMGISMMINPDYETAEQIGVILEYPAASSVEEFANGKVNMIEMPLSDDRLDGITINEFRNRYTDIIVCLILRDGEVIIPDGSTIIKKNDLISVTGTHEDLITFYNDVGLIDKKLKSTLIIGGGRITHYLLKQLDLSQTEVKVIELKKDVAIQLSHQFPEVIVINGDGSDQDFLNEERIGHFDSVINLTGIDEENMLISLYALKMGVEKVITKINRTDLISLIGATSLQGIVTPTRLITNKILRLIRSIVSKNSDSDIEMLYRIADNQAEAIQFHVRKELPYTGITLQELTFKKGVIMAYIVRNGQLIFPTGQDCIYNDDQVIFITTLENITSIEELLE